LFRAMGRILLEEMIACGGFRARRALHPHSKNYKNQNYKNRFTCSR
jgi:hypothetical protein